MTSGARPWSFTVVSKGLARAHLAPHLIVGLRVGDRISSVAIAAGADEVTMGH